MVNLQTQLMSILIIISATCCQMSFTGAIPQPSFLKHIYATEGETEFLSVPHS